MLAKKKQLTATHCGKKFVVPEHVRPIRDKVLAFVEKEVYPVRCYGVVLLLLLRVDCCLDAELTL